MRTSKRLAVLLAVALLLAGPVASLQAKTRKGDQLYAQGYQAEQKKDYEKAVGLYDQALATDPGDLAYQMAARRVRFQAAQVHVGQGQKLRDQGNLGEAMAEFEKALALDSSSEIAAQEMQITRDMAERAKTRPVKPEDRGLSPFELAGREADAKLAAVRSVPVLKPISTAPINLTMNNRTPRVLFETVGKLAGINVLFDPDLVQAMGTAKPLSVDLTNATLEQAFDYLSLMTKYFWKPVTANAIFVAQDTAAKRTDYEEQVAQVFYIRNASAQADLTEVMNAIRTVTLAQRIVPINSQNALLVRGTADQVALAGMLIRNLDQPKSEVVVDVILMEVSKTNSRDLGASLVSGGANGLSVPATFTGGAAATGTAASSGVRLSRLGGLSTNDFSIALPGAQLKALMSSSDTRVLQSPQVRAVDGMKASLKIGDRVPYSTGGIQTGTAGGLAGGVFNSFQYLDVGVNVDITPKVHGTDEVTLHVELDVSNVKDRIDIGGISQPEVGQRKVVHDIRLKEGEVSLLGGLVQSQETRSVSGLPVLSSIPGLGRLFSIESTTKNTTELLIAIVPHVVRGPALDELSFKGIASGNERTVRLSYAPPATGGGAPAVTPQAPAAQPQAPAAQPIQPIPLPVPGVPQAAAPAGTPRIIFSPSPAEAQTGGTLTLSIQAANVTDLFSAPLRIKFDQNVLRLDEVNRGGFLAGDGREILFTRNILNDSGEASVILSRMPGSGGLSGSGTLLTFTFKVIGKGVTTISVPSLTLQDSRGQAIRAASPQVAITVK